MNISELAAYLNLKHQSQQPIHQFKIDSRLIEPGDVFVAFKGQYQDGHDFAQAAEQKSAAAIIAERELPDIHIPVLQVADSFQALTDAAHAYRSTIHPLVLALTGSNGKTTVKEMLHAIMPPPCFASLGNFNNQLGVPLNILNLPVDARYAIFELGASQSGDIAYTAAMVKPDIALINNIGPAHLSGFGSIEGVARAKGEIYQSLTANGLAVVNADDPYANSWATEIGTHKIIRFSSQIPADVWAAEIQEQANGCYDFKLHYADQVLNIQLVVPGRHQVQNALAAASMAYAAGIEGEQIIAGLMRFSGVKGRMNFYPGFEQAHIIDDSYNANLASVKVGLEYLAKRQGEKILVLGDMAELGEYTQTAHAEIGKIAHALGIDRILALGVATVYTVDAFGERGLHFSDAAHLISYLKEHLHPHAHVLIKGSRSSRMEEIVEQLITR